MYIWIGHYSIVLSWSPLLHFSFFLSPPFNSSFFMSAFCVWCLRCGDAPHFCKNTNSWGWKRFPLSLSYSLWRPLFSLPKSLKSLLNAASNPSMLRCPGTPSGGCQRFYLEPLCHSPDWGRASHCVANASAITMQTGRLYWVYWVLGCLGKPYVVIKADAAIIHRSGNRFQQ